MMGAVHVISYFSHLDLTSVDVAKITVNVVLTKLSYALANIGVMGLVLGMITLAANEFLSIEPFLEKSHPLFANGLVNIWKVCPRTGSIPSPVPKRIRDLMKQEDEAKGRREPPEVQLETESQPFVEEGEATSSAPETADLDSRMQAPWIAVESSETEKVETEKVPAMDRPPVEAPPEMGMSDLPVPEEEEVPISEELLDQSFSAEAPAPLPPPVKASDEPPASLFFTALPENWGNPVQGEPARQPTPQANPQPVRQPAPPTSAPTSQPPWREQTYSPPAPPRQKPADPIPDPFTMSALPSDWAGLPQQPSEMAPLPSASPWRSVDSGAMRPESRLNLLRHRLGVLDQYLRKASYERSQGLITEEIYREEYTRWGRERERVAEEIKVAMGLPRKAASPSRRASFAQSARRV